MIASSAVIMSTNRIEPAYIEKKEAEHELKRHAENLIDSFEWVISAGKSAKAEGRRLLTLFGIQLGLAMVLIYVPAYLYGRPLSSLVLRVTKKGEPVDPEQDSFICHLIRTCVIIGGGWAVFVIFMGLLAAIPFIAKKGKRRDKLMSSRMMNFLHGQSEVAPHVSMFVGSLVSSICAQYYYPGTLAPIDAAKQLTVASVDEKAVLDGTVDAFVKALTSFSTTVQRLFNYRSLFPLAVHMTFIALFILMVEKIALQIIAISYRSTTSAGRFTSNYIALKLIKHLFRAKADPELLVADRNIGKSFDRDIAKMVYNAMVPEESGRLLTVECLKEVLGEEQAVILFKFLDIAQNGDLTRQEFIEAVKAIFDESRALDTLLKDHDDIIAKVDSMLLVGVYSLDIAFALSYLGVSFTSLAVGIGFMLLGAVAFFDDAVKKLIKSLVFVLITHPYDAGDRIELDGEIYVIESVGIWTTTMYAPGQLKTVVVNAALFDKTISNFRRSPSENEVLEFLCLPDTVNEESLEALKQDLMNFLREKRREFQAQLVIDSVDYIDPQRMKVCLKIFHRQNFQDDDAKAERTAMFLLYAKDAFLRNGFVFSPPLQKVLVARL